MSAKARVAVVGATGYTGAELLRLLLSHPSVEITSIVGGTKAGQPIADVIPSLAGILEGNVDAFDADRVAASADAAFCALPHGASAGPAAPRAEFASTGSIDGGSPEIEWFSGDSVQSAIRHRGASSRGAGQGRGKTHRC